MPIPIPPFSSPFDPRDRRIENIEKFLSPFERQEVSANVTGLGGRKIDVLARIGTEAALASGGGPFSVYQTDTTAGAEACAVAPGQIITNVVTGDAITTVTWPESILLASDTIVWIEVVVAADLTATSLEIKSGTTWPEGVTFAGDVQTKACVVIGAVFADTMPQGVKGFDFVLTRNNVQNSYHFRQLIQTNRLMAIMAIDGKVAIYPYSE